MRKNPHREALQKFYDQDVDRRGKKELPQWKASERKRFAERVIRSREKEKLLEIGAGTGRDARFFAAQGIKVVAIDISEKMVIAGRTGKVQALCMDVLELAFENQSFQAVYALNSLLHLSQHTLPLALEEIKRVLKPDGLFYYGVYGGRRFEGIHENDWTATKRFFNYYRDEEIKQLAAAHFNLIEFRPIPLTQAYHFQSMTWQKAA